MDQDPGLRISTIDQSQDLRIGIHLDNSALATRGFATRCDKLSTRYQAGIT